MVNATDPVTDRSVKLVPQHSTQQKIGSGKRRTPACHFET